MKKLTTKLMIATAALVVVAGAVSAQTQTMKASIPFEFRAGNRVMAAGTYRIENLSPRIGSPLFRLLNVESGGSIAVLPQAPVDPKEGWTAGNAKLLFACAGGNCALTELWSGSGRYAYKFYGPKLGKNETAVLREIPMQPAKGE